MDFTDQEKEKIKEYLSDEIFLGALLKITGEVKLYNLHKMYTKPKDDFWKETNTLLISRGGCLALQDLEARLKGLAFNS